MLNTWLTPYYDWDPFPHEEKLVLGARGWSDPEKVKQHYAFIPNTCELPVSNTGMSILD